MSGTLLREGSAGAAPLAPPLIEARGLSMTYRTARGDTVLALDGLDFTVAEGEFISVVGPSGCGKSTLMKILGGLLGRTGGDITVSGRSVSGPGPDVGVVFQAPVLLPWRTILQNVLLPSEMRRLAAPRERALALLETVGLGGFENRYPHELSGGMQQRASIVRALVGDPKLLLMDEPWFLAAGFSQSPASAGGLWFHLGVTMAEALMGFVIGSGSTRSSRRSCLEASMRRRQWGTT